MKEGLERRSILQSRHDRPGDDPFAPFGRQAHPVLFGRDQTGVKQGRTVRQQGEVAL
ncbi:hypothetical protein D3C72_1742240 [compost metagenome]